MCRTAAAWKIPAEPVEKFADAAEGVSACQKIYAEIRKMQTQAAETKAKKSRFGKGEYKSVKAAAKKAAAKPKPKVKATPAKKVAANKPAPAARVTTADDAKLMWLDKPVPFREGTGAHQRTMLAKKHNGKLVSTFLAAGGRRSTLGTLRRGGLLKLEGGN